MRRLIAVLAVAGGVLAAVFVGTAVASADSPPMTHNMKAAPGMTHN
jgi:hypothetical protein